jgi:hypothetical protein
MASRALGKSDLAFEASLRGEKATTLGRVGSRIETLLSQLADVEAKVRAGDGVRSELVARHAELREQAKLQLWYLVVQREAMGLFRHHDVYRVFLIPPRLD